MAKVEPKTLGEAYKGTLSTFIVTLIILGIGFFLPMISAKEIQDAREGKGRYTPVDNIFWNLEHNSDMSPILIDHISDTSSVAGRYEWGLNTATYGSPFDQENTPFSMYWVYKSQNVHTSVQRMSYHNLNLNFMDLEFDNSDKVEGNYIRTTLLDTTTWNGYRNAHYLGTNMGHFRREEIRVWMELDINQWNENDAIKIHFYFECESTIDYTEVDITAISKNTGSFYRLKSELIDTTTNKEIEMEIEITLDDLINILNKQSDGRLALSIAFRSRTSTGSSNVFAEFNTNSEVIFDLQIYGLKSKTNAITLLSIWYVVQAIGIFMLGIVMLPQISIGDLARKLNIASES